MEVELNTNFVSKKELNHGHIAFSMARIPGSEHYYHGASDSGVYQVDHADDSDGAGACSRLNLFRDQVTENHTWKYYYVNYIQ